MTRTIDANELEVRVAAVMTAAGCSVAEGKRVARRLVGANLVGHDSHGVVRTSRYVAMLEAGRQVADVAVTVESDSEAFAIVDGRFGMGQTVGEQAVQLGIDKCVAGGVSIIALRHAGHLGRIGDWAEMAAEAGLVSIHFVNVAGSNLVAPFGAISRRMATNPVAIGVPRGDDEPPVILDFATSIVAEGKALIASQGGAVLPGDALINGDGELTNDPHALYGDKPPSEPGTKGGAGALRAMGDHKGSGLSMMCELLAGVLTRSGTANDETFCNGMLSIYLDPAVVAEDRDEFIAEVQRYVEWFLSAEPAAGHDAVLAPGDVERAKRADRLANGIELADDTWQSIVDAAHHVGLDPSDW